MYLLKSIDKSTIINIIKKVYLWVFIGELGCSKMLGFTDIYHAF